MDEEKWLWFSCKYLLIYRNATILFRKSTKHIKVQSAKSEQAQTNSPKEFMDDERNKISGKKLTKIHECDLFTKCVHST